MAWYLLSSLLMGFFGFAIYLICLKKGMFDDTEDIKYQMFRDDRDEEGK